MRNIPWIQPFPLNFHVRGKQDWQREPAGACLSLWPWRFAVYSCQELGPDLSCFRPVLLVTHQKAAQSQWTVIHFEVLKTNESLNSTPSSSRRSSGQRKAAPAYAASTWSHSPSSLPMAKTNIIIIFQIIDPMERVNFKIKIYLMTYTLVPDRIDCRRHTRL